MRILRWVAVLALVAPGVAVPVASATPPRGVSAEVLWQRPAADTEFIFRRITIEPGGSTGWHWHRGHLVGVVVEGTLTHHRADCSVDGTYPTGAQIVEDGGPENVHIGLNTGDVPMVLEVMYVDPLGAALSEDAPNPGCPFD
jgi:hypothetical protein